MKTLFVGGSQRSGTTLLNKFICLNTETNPKLAEASHLRELITAYRNALADFDHDTCDYFETREDLRNFHSHIINLFLNHTRNRYGNIEQLVLKEPHLTQFFPELFDLVPHAKFVLIARDPRDIISSMIKVGERMAKQEQAHFFQERNIEHLCQLVLSFYLPSLNCQNPAFKNNMLAIRYEDLINNTKDIKNRLQQFTGLPFDFANDENPDASKARDIGEALPRYQPWITDNNDKPINDSSIGRYHKVLSEEEIEQINHLLKDFMSLFHYPATQSGDAN